MKHHPWLHRDLVFEGRQDEEIMIAYREQEGGKLKDTLKPGEEQKEESLMPTGSEVRGRLGETQWQDPEVRELLHALAATKTAANLPDAGGGGKVISGRPFRLGPDLL